MIKDIEMTINHTIKTFVLFGMLGFLASCTSAGKDDTGLEYAPNMYNSVSYKPLKQITDKEEGALVSSIDDGQGEYYNSNPYNPHNMNMREPVANTVKRNKNGFLPYRVPKDSLQWAAANLKNPYTAEEAGTEGEDLYMKFCSHCHGDTGAGDGKVGMIFQGVPNYTARPTNALSQGHIFHIITYGIRRMARHDSQLSVEERWKIARHVEKLQNQ